MRKLGNLLLLLVVVLLSVIPAFAQERPSVLEILENDADARFTTFVAAIDAAGLRDTLEGEGPFTILAPTNDAFSAALEAMGVTADQALMLGEGLQPILLNHVIDGRYFFRNLTGGPTLETLSGESVTFDLTDGVFTVNGVNISDPDQLGSNGIVHAIDGVIVPESVMAMMGGGAQAEPTPEATPAPEVVAPTRPTVSELLAADADGRFTTFLAAIDAAGLRDTLEGEGPFTVLAPTNDAFSAALETMGMTAEQALAMGAGLQPILLNHIIDGRYFFRNLTSGPTLETLSGESVTFDLTDGVFTVNGVNISDPDNLGSNGIFHAIDGVIVPQSIMAMMGGGAQTEPTPEATPVPEATPEPQAVAPTRPTVGELLAADADGRFTTLLAAVDAAGLTDALNGEGPITVLAPTNDAFAAALTYLGMSQADLFADTATLTQILTYHVIPGQYFFRNLTGGPTLGTVQGESVTFDLTDGVFTVNGVGISDPDQIGSNGVFHAIDGVLLPADITAAAEANRAHVRFVNLAPTYGAADFYNNGNLAGENIAYGGATDWAEIAAGSVRAGVAPTGGAANNTGIGTVEPGSWVTIVVTGTTENRTLRVNYITEDYSAPAENRARVSVLHTVENLGVVDVLANGQLMIGALAYPGSQGGNDGIDTRDLPAGTYNLSVNQAGTSTVVVGDTTFNFDAGGNYLVLITGAPGSARLQVLTTPAASE